MTFKLSRRQFFQFTSALTLTSVSHNRFSNRNNIEILPSKIEILAQTKDGLPLDFNTFNRLYFLTLQDEPIPEPPRQIEAGKLISQLPDFPCAIAIRMPIQGFGEVTLYADNKSRGYFKEDFPLNLNFALADSRLYRVNNAIFIWQQQGIQFPVTITNRLKKAQVYLEQKLYDHSLAESLWAGEEAVFEQAKQKIAKQNPRPDFLFGCNFFSHPYRGKKYDKCFKELFNFATVPFYWRTFEPQLGQKDFASVDTKVNWLSQAKIIPKGHPLVWFHEAGIPDAVKEKSYAEIKQLVSERVTEITSYYRDKIAYYDIINEANGIVWANELDFSLEQFIELTYLASIAAYQGNPQVIRIINNCCLWAENVAYLDPPQYSPYEYLKACLNADINFEVIGLQLYYPDQDMFEIHRLLERFSQLGKPIHITELGVSSSTKIDETAYLKEPSGLWREPWSETIQANWIEQFYTLCYSKSYIHAISWWDLADSGTFWPHGGLLHKDMTPKLSFLRLHKLIQEFKRI